MNINLGRASVVAGLLGVGSGVARGELPRHLDWVVISRSQGTMFAIDPATGLIRSIVTGRDLRDGAKPVRGTGTQLNGALSGDIGTSWDGRIFWKLAPGANAWATYQIDASSGNRSGLFGSGGALHNANGTPVVLNAKTLLLAADDFNTASNSNGRVLRYGLPGGPTTVVSGDLVGDGPRTLLARSMTLSDNRTAYVAEVGALAGSTAGAGVFKVDLLSGARTFVSRLTTQTVPRRTVTGGVLSGTTTQLSRGAGPVCNGQVRSLLWREGKLYAGVSSQKPDQSFVSGILEIDPATGNRTLVVGTAVLEDGTTFVTNAPANAGAPSFDSASGLTLLADRSIVFTSLFTYNTVLRLKPETRELTVAADLGPQVTADVRGAMLLTGMAQFRNCPGDLNLDGAVDDADFVLFVGMYDLLDCADVGIPVGCPGDLNGDLVVDDGDFVVFVGAYEVLVCE